VRVGKKVRRGHNVTWEIHNGLADPAGHQPDHTCRGKLPASGPHHLELVTCGKKQEESLALPKADDALPEGPRDDAGEHVPQAWERLPGMPEMPFEHRVPSAHIDTIVVLPSQLVVKYSVGAPSQEL
jgi:hypothetical protein